MDIQVPAGQEQAFFRLQEESGLFFSRKLPEKNKVKNEGGGLSDLFTSPLYIVYGTKAPSKTDELKRLAEVLADWRVSPEMRVGVKVGKFRVKADVEITEEEIKGCSLLLLGSPTENHLLERAQSDLPVKWRGEGIEIEEVFYPRSGLTLVCPNPMAPRNLLGIISLPFPPRGNEAFVRQLVYTLSAYGVRGEDTASVTTPDLMVVNDTGRISYVASYDADWEELIPVQ